jgi:uncharacterized membrane protein
VTPKTDIVQSVGRILRTKHSNPIVVDIVDKHQLFQNQWNKRKIYYKKSNYSIKIINTDKYSNMISMDNWKNVNEPKNCLKNKDKDDEVLLEKTDRKCLIDISSL